MNDAGVDDDFMMLLMMICSDNVADDDAGHDNDDDAGHDYDDESSLMIPHLTLKYFQQILHYTWHRLERRPKVNIFRHYHTDTGASLTKHESAAKISAKIILGPKNVNKLGENLTHFSSHGYCWSKSPS